MKLTTKEKIYKTLGILVILMVGASAPGIVDNILLGWGL
jgi:hypothetical protein